MDHDDFSLRTPRISSLLSSLTSHGPKHRETNPSTTPICERITTARVSALAKWTHADSTSRRETLEARERRYCARRKILNTRADDERSTTLAPREHATSSSRAGSMLRRERPFKHYLDLEVEISLAL